MSSMKIKKRLRKVLLNILVVLSLGAFYYMIDYVGLGFPCVFHKITGLYCPGCGVTRMFKFLLKLDFESAYKSNRLIFIFLPIWIVLFSVRSVKYILYDEKIVSRSVNIILNIMILTSIIFSILRNIPCFYFLRPI